MPVWLTAGFRSRGMAHPGYVYEIMCEIQNFQRETETKALEPEHTKYEVNPSILKWCMPKKIFRPQNLGIKSLTLVSTKVVQFESAK